MQLTVHSSRDGWEEGSIDRVKQKVIGATLMIGKKRENIKSKETRKYNNKYEKEIKNGGKNCMERMKERKKEVHTYTKTHCHHTYTHTVIHTYRYSCVFAGELSVCRFFFLFAKAIKWELHWVVVFDIPNCCWCCCCCCCCCSFIGAVILLTVALFDFRAIVSNKLNNKHTDIHKCSHVATWANNYNNEMQWLLCNCKKFKFHVRKNSFWKNFNFFFLITFLFIFFFFLMWK